MKYKTKQNLLTFSYIIIFGSLSLYILFIKDNIAGVFSLIFVFIFFTIFRIRDMKDPYMDNDANVSGAEE